MAKSLGGGFPIGAFWVRDRHADLLGPGQHASTFGGTPLACAVALKVLDVIEREGLADNARRIGEQLKAGLEKLILRYPSVLRQVRGLGLMIGIELADKETIPASAGQTKTAAAQFVDKLHEAGILTVPAGQQVVRLLPPLNVSRPEADEALDLIERVVKSLVPAKTR